MDKAKPDFKRMLLRLPHSADDYAAVALIAELAGLLGADLIGTYVDDVNLQSLVDLPDAREFRAGAWQPMNSRQLALDLASATRRAERLFLQYAGHHRPAFRVVDSAGATAREADSDDIIVVIEPKSPLERATHQFSELLEDAYRSSSSILWVPSETRRFVGPVVVMASEPDDPCISAAVAIAASAKERVILIPESHSIEGFLPALDLAKAAGVAASLTDAVFQQNDLLLPPHIKAGLLIAGRGGSIQRRNLLQIPTLFVASSRASRSPGVRPNHSRPD
jgi:hypothetical protein